MDVNIDDESGNAFNTYREEEMETDNQKSYCFDEGGQYCAREINLNSQDKKKFKYIKFESLSNYSRSSLW